LKRGTRQASVQLRLSVLGIYTVVDKPAMAPEEKQQAPG